MNICAWNVRGFNEPSRAVEAGRLFRQYNVGLFRLLETKVKKDNSGRIMERMSKEWQWQQIMIVM